MSEPIAGVQEEGEAYLVVRLKDVDSACSFLKSAGVLRSRDPLTMPELGLALFAGTPQAGDAAQDMTRRLGIPCRRAQAEGDRLFVSTSRIAVSLAPGSRAEDVLVPGSRLIGGGPGWVGLKIDHEEDLLEILEDLRQRSMTVAVDPAPIELLSEPSVPTPLPPGARDALSIIGVEKAWARHPDASGIVVAVLDDGVEADHPDLNGACITGFDAVTMREGQAPGTRDHHGTACAGLVGARPASARGLRGVAAGCTILPIRIFVRVGGFFAADPFIARQGIDAAVDRGAHILSLSWTIRAAGDLVASAIRTAIAKGRLVVAAAGNDTGPVGSPASYPGVLAVGATDLEDRLVVRERHGWDSASGARLDLVAPGVGLRCADLLGPRGATGDDYNLGFDGTSASAAVVAGAAASLWSAGRRFSAKDVVERLVETAVEIPPSADGLTHRRVDLAAALSTVHAVA